MATEQSIGHFQAALRVYKDNFWMERQQQGKTEDEIQQEWVNSTQGINSILGAAVPFERPHKSADSMLTAELPSNLAETSVGAVSMRRRRTVRRTGTECKYLADMFNRTIRYYHGFSLWRGLFRTHASVRTRPSLTHHRQQR